MRGSFVVAAALIASSAVVAHAQQGASAPSTPSITVVPQAYPQPLPPAYWKAQDSEAAIDAAVARVFPKLDTDGNGRLSRDELLSFGVARHWGTALRERKFKEMDTNHDGSISRDEFRAAAVAYMKEHAAATPAATAPSGGDHTGEQHVGGR